MDMLNQFFLCKCLSSGDKKSTKEENHRPFRLAVEPIVYRPLSRGAMLIFRGIKSFVFAQRASPRREISARLAVQKQSFLFS